MPGQVLRNQDELNREHQLARQRQTV
jgi:hypothetical protein